MIRNNKDEIRENDTVLTALMALLNISVLLIVGLLIWSVYSLAGNSVALIKLMNGGFLP